MGFFSLHETCSCCGATTGFSKYKCKGGYLCPSCLKRARSLKLNYNSFTMSGSILREMFDGTYKEEERNNFGEYMKVDRENKLLYIKSVTGNKVVKFNDLASVNIIEDRETKTKSNAGKKAVFGTLLFGKGAGVLLGLTSKEKHLEYVKRLEVKIETVDEDAEVIYIEILTTRLKRKSKIYGVFLKSACTIAEEINNIIHKRNEEIEDLILEMYNQAVREENEKRPIGFRP